MAVVATMSKGYDLEYIWKNVDRGAAKDAARYYIQASETGGEPPGRWWSPGAKALGFEPGQRVEREPYDLLFGERGIWGRARGPDSPGPVPVELELARAGQKAVALAQQDKSARTRADVIKYLGRGPAPHRDGPGRGRRVAGGPG